MSLARRLSLIQVVVILVVMGVFSFALSSLITRRIQERTEDTLKQQVALLLDMFQTYNAALEQSAETLNSVLLSSFPGEFAVESGKTMQMGEKQVPQLKSGALVVNGNTEIVDRFARVTQASSAIFVRAGEDFIRIATSTKDEKGVRMEGTLLDRANPAYAHLIAGERFTGKVTVGGKELMSSYVPIKDAQGKTVGAVAASIDFTAGLKTLSDKVLAVKIGKTGYIYAMDAKPGPEQGTNRIHPVSTGKSFIHLKDAHGKEFIADIIERKEGIARYWWVNQTLKETTAREKVAAFGYMKEWDWVVVAGSYMDELNTEGVFLRNAMLGATIMVMLVLVGVFVLMVRRWISEPLHRAIQVTDLLAAGDFRQIADLHEEHEPTSDEVEQLQRGINRMAHSLCELLEKIHVAAEELTGASREIAASANRSSETAQNQSNKTTQVATAMLEMSATVEEVSKNSQQAAHAAQMAADTAQKGGAVVRETLETMRKIASATEVASTRIGELGESSNQIGAIASVISDIAGQTNLLALNAAIEAARAGEQGRGFAVVAGEVRRLAERTAEATKEITGMIGSIQQQSREAVKAMQGESEEVAVGVSKTETSGKALEQIIDMAGKVGDMVAQIATAATEQSAATEEVNRNVSHIAEMTTESSHNAGDTAMACRNLSNLAASLQSVVGQFKFNR
jgi:methyl-accepting chemotaxis protein